MSRILTEGTATVPFAYPRDLARYLQVRWPAVVDERVRRKDDKGVTDALPELPLLEKLLSTCYQAGLMMDEGREVRFRLILRAPDRLRRHEGPPFGLHRLIFDPPRTYTPHELRRLAPAAPFNESLIGVEPDEEDGFRIWGIVQSGPRWMEEQYGGRRPSCPLPASLVVHVTAPGVIVIGAGSMVLGRLEGGRVLSTPIDIYASHWLSRQFAESREEIWRLHSVARMSAERNGEAWGQVHPDLTRLVTEQMVKRIISTIRNTHHGGLLVILPPEDAARVERLQTPNAHPPVRLKYRFREEEARARFRTLIIDLLGALARAHPEYDGNGSRGLAGWAEFQTSADKKLAAYDEAILEISHLTASLAAVDGAVVLSKRYELIGFGGEISSELPLVPWVAQALDTEAEESLPVSTDSVGTRHRAAYRLVNEIRGALAIVVSQDGEVRFVTWNDGAVTYWEQ